MQSYLLNEDGHDRLRSTRRRSHAENIAIVGFAIGCLLGLLGVGCVTWSVSSLSRRPPPADASSYVVRNAVDQFFGNAVDQFFGRTHSVPALDNTDLDNTALGAIHRGSISVARSPRSPSWGFPAFRSPLPVFHHPVVAHADAEERQGGIKPQAMTSDSGNVIEAETIEAETAAVGSEATMGDKEKEERAELKRNLLRLCASYDRGFGATPRARNDVDALIRQLEVLNPIPTEAARGVGGEPSSPEDGPPPLKGIWRMVWTTALDVLSLGVNPVALPGAIYQVIEPPIATNIIDFIPRAQALFPTVFPASLLRAEVKTRAAIRTDKPNRVALNFEEVKLVPKEFLGQNAEILPPVNFNLPQVNANDLPGVDPSTAPGYFDVLYLDEDMLIIQQNAPGGYFVLINVPDCDP
eukprot:gnl/TRDRNA2_/TRDRNA2_80872_c0_seq1.p1 gnl/TRDRNA2_/TRDRNA2_80872_c0~~gnl/TRDRNA2_/TRDRNA2_80872_c0_seq1.p1  ORF type:complete len:410 (-),score=45.56 gnl/TRDRNA2_/TRDRNA2_80872_c0_seq1:84-1313(-)